MPVELQLVNNKSISWSISLLKYIKKGVGNAKQLRPSMSIQLLGCVACTRQHPALGPSLREQSGGMRWAAGTELQRDSQRDPQELHMPEPCLLHLIELHYHWQDLTHIARVALPKIATSQS